MTRARAIADSAPYSPQTQVSTVLPHHSHEDNSAGRSNLHSTFCPSSLDYQIGLGWPRSIECLALKIPQMTFIFLPEGTMGRRPPLSSFRPLSQHLCLGPQWEQRTVK